MTRSLVAILSVTALAAVIAGPAALAQTAPQGPPPFDAARAWAHLTKQVSFGPRPSGSAALNTTRQ